MSDDCAFLAARPPPPRLAFTQFAFNYEHDCVHSLVFTQLFRLVKDKETLKCSAVRRSYLIASTLLITHHYIANGLPYTDDLATFIH